MSPRGLHRSHSHPFMPRRRHRSLWTGHLRQWGRSGGASAGAAAGTSGPPPSHACSACSCCWPATGAAGFAGFVTHCSLLLEELNGGPLRLCQSCQSQATAYRDLASRSPIATVSGRKEVRHLQAERADDVLDLASSPALQEHPSVLAHTNVEGRILVPPPSPVPRHGTARVLLASLGVETKRPHSQSQQVPQRGSCGHRDRVASSEALGKVGAHSCACCSASSQADRSGHVLPFATASTSAVMMSCSTQLAN
jgi:hypothetical protein